MQVVSGGGLSWKDRGFNVRVAVVYSNLWIIGWKPKGTRARIHWKITNAFQVIMEIIFNYALPNTSGPHRVIIGAAYIQKPERTMWSAGRARSISGMTLTPWSLQASGKPMAVKFTPGFSKQGQVNVTILLLALWCMLDPIADLSLKLVTER